MNNDMIIPPGSSFRQSNPLFQQFLRKSGSNPVWPLELDIPIGHCPTHCEHESRAELEVPYHVVREFEDILREATGYRIACSIVSRGSSQMDSEGGKYGQRVDMVLRTKVYRG